MRRAGGALAAALGLHVALALALGRLRPAPTPTPLPPPIVFVDVRAPAPPMASAPPPIASAPPAVRVAPSRALALVSGAHRRRHRSSAPSTPSPATPADEPRGDATAAPVTHAPASGPVDLFPRGVLEALSAHAAASTGAPPPGRATADQPTETPAGDLDDAVAAARTRSGQVAPVWRSIERALVEGFHPPVDAVHDRPARGVDRFADRMRSWFKQQVAMVARGEDGLRHPVEPGSTIVSALPGASIDPSQESFQGVPEGRPIKVMPLAQQQAAAAAAGDPAAWLRVEIEVAVDAAGAVQSVRVAMPSGRRAFDRYAVGAVRDAVSRAAPPSSLSRWSCEAGYAVSRPDMVGLTFDVQMLFDKKLRRQLAGRYPLQERVDARVSLQWVKPLPPAAPR